MSYFAFAYSGKLTELHEIKCQKFWDFKICEFRLPIFFCSSPNDVLTDLIRLIVNTTLLATALSNV